MPNLISILQGRPVSVILLFVTGCVSAAALRNRDLYLQCILHPQSVIKRKEVHRLFSSVLVHNDVIHLLINGALLVLICGEFEEYLNARSVYGSLVFLMFYLLSHLVGATRIAGTGI